MHARLSSLIDELQQLGISHPNLLDVMASIPRHVFLPAALSHRAYENNALPIGQGQTLSQPSTVASMTQYLLAHCAEYSIAHPKILEIGTGSGYQTAVLAKLFENIYSVERIKALQFHARRRLNQLDCHRVKLKHGDGWEGWSGQAPFDCIIVTAAASTLPQALVQQLNDNGCMIIPLGDSQQTLTYVRKVGDKIQQIALEEARFVPLIQGELQ